MDAVTDFKVKGIKPLRLDRKVFNFLFVSRLEMVKGPDVLIEACKYLKMNTDNFNLHVIGDGSMRSKLAKNISRWELVGNVFLHGIAGKEEVISYMKGADCLMVTSRHESIPLVMVEAARCGLASIATDVGDCRRVMENIR